MSYAEKLNELSLAYGVEPFYWDVHGIQHIATDEAKRLLLAAMGVRAETDEDVELAVKHYQREKWAEIFPPAASCFVDELPLKLAIRVTAEQRTLPLKWRFTSETNDQQSGQNDLTAVSVLEHARVDEIEYFQIETIFALRPEPGYHRLELDLGSAHGSLLLIVSPTNCYIPPCLGDSKKVWGIALQLYSLRSTNNWGIGDLGDLSRDAHSVSSSGAKVVGLNPLHALFERDHENVSPYSPNSRLARNLSIIEIESVPEYLSSPEVQQFVSHEGFQARLQAARAAELIDYAAAWALKFEVFERLYAAFDNAAPERLSAFESFISRSGEPMRGYALYSALREKFLVENPALWGWPVWPREYRAWDSPAVRAFAEEEAHRVRFYYYLQFVAEEQLAAAEKQLVDAGVDLGLYLDLALGANCGGAETWMNQGLYAIDASAGAPPDELGPNGQDWGLPPVVPERLRQAAYRPFIDVVRYNMRGAGALRIDHVMSLFRLFWIAKGAQAADGAYVRYPFRDLLAIVTLESNRERTLVIGEDLGTVPDEVRAGMKQTGILSYKVLYFAKDADGIIASKDFPRNAIVVTGTHDLPTLNSYWSGGDIELRKSLNLFAEPELHDLMESMRLEDRTALLSRMVEEGLIQKEQEELLLKNGMTEELSLVFHTYLANTPCMLQMLQLEDVLDMTEQINVPGTVNEHPNWRRKLPLELNEILETPLMIRLKEVIEKGRRTLA